MKLHASLLKCCSLPGLQHGAAVDRPGSRSLHQVLLSEGTWSRAMEKDRQENGCHGRKL